MKQLKMTPGETPAGDIRDAFVRSAFQRWEPGASCGLHFHPGAGELFVFLGGACDVEVVGKLLTCEVGDCVYVEPGERHRLTVAGDAACAFFVAVFPNRSPQTVWVHADGTLEEEG